MVGTSVKLEAIYVLAFSMVQQHKKQLKIIGKCTIWLSLNSYIHENL